MKTFLFAGLGSIARRHIANLKSLMPCRILAYRVRNENFEDFEKQYDISSFKGLDLALQNSPDAVFVTNPTSHHISVALKVARQGIPLFIEKPLSHNLTGVDKLIEICEQNIIPAFVAYKMRFHKSIRFLKELVDSGALGRVSYAKAHYGGNLKAWHPWEDYRRMYSARKELGGGVILDASHEIDYLSWIFKDICEIKAIAGKFSDLEIDCEDTASILIHFKNDVIGSVHTNYVQQPDYRSCEIGGDQGTAIWQEYRNSIDVYTEESGQWVSHPQGDSKDNTQSMFFEEVKHFLACLDGSEQPICTLRDAKRVLEIALEAKKSVRVQSEQPKPTP